MSDFLTALASGRVILFDGAMGTALQGRGLGQGECPERWNLERGEDVRAVSAAYVAAGCDVVSTNTFGGSRLKLGHYGLGERVAEVNRVGAALAKEAAGERAWVAGSMGPTGAMMEPYGEVSEAAVREVFAEQAAALADGGADLILVETMMALEEALAAVRGAKEGAGLPVVVTFTFEKTGKGFRTMMGVRPEQVAVEAPAAGADAVGSNCGSGIEQMIEVCRELRGANGEVALLVQPNAGLPEVDAAGRTVYRQGPGEMAGRVGELVAAGARLVGGCCGTTPEHLAAMRGALEAAGRREE